MVRTFASLALLTALAGCSVEPPKLESSRPGPPTVDLTSGVAGDASVDVPAADTRDVADVAERIDGGDAADSNVPGGDVPDGDDGGDTVVCTHFDCRWQARVRIDLRHSGDTLGDFPVPVVLEQASFPMDQVHNDGTDLRFVDRDGTPLDHEIERWDPLGQTVAWVRVPALESDGDWIWLYFQGPDDATAGFEPDATAVWDVDHVGVWHLDHDIGDSTANGNDGGMVTATRYAPGLLGDGWSLNGAGGSTIVVPDDPSLDTIDDAITMSAWLFRRDDGWGWHQIMSRERFESFYEHFGMGYKDDRWRPITHNAADNRLNPDFGPLHAGGSWLHVATTWDASQMRLYVNGAMVTSTGSQGGVLADDDNPLILGGNVNDHTTMEVGEVPDATVDEIRLSRRARTAAWIEASYRAMDGQMVVVGTPEQL